MTQISEVTAIDPGRQADRDHSTFSTSATASRLQPTGYLPTFIDSLVEKDLLGRRIPLWPGRRTRMETPDPILAPLGCLLIGMAVGTFAWSAEGELSRALAFVERDLADKLRRLRLPTANLRALRHCLAWSHRLQSSSYSGSCSEARSSPS